MKILIFYGSYGGGHLSAAKNIKENIEKNYQNNEILMIDCIEYINKIINNLTTKAYSDLSKNGHWLWKHIYNNSEEGITSRISNTINRLMAIKLNKLFKTFTPDIIVSTHPFSSQMCAILKKKGKIKAKLATILTDYEAHNQWLMYSEYVDYFFVAHQGMKDELISRGITDEKIHVTGIPLSSKFLLEYDKTKILEEFELKSNRTTILFFAGGEYGFGKEKNFKILKSLIEEFHDIQIVAIAGKNVKMKEKFENLVMETKSNDRVRVLAYTNQVPELMTISDLVISKPGGLTTTESLASGLPIIVINPMPGQEEANARFLEENYAGIWIKKQDDVVDKLKVLLNSKEKIEQMKENARKLAKRNSTQDICKILFDKK